MTREEIEKEAGALALKLQSALREEFNLKSLVVIGAVADHGENAEFAFMIAGISGESFKSFGMLPFLDDKIKEDFPDAQPLLGFVSKVRKKVELPPLDLASGPGPH